MLTISEQVIKRMKFYDRVERRKEAQEKRKQKLINKNYYVEGHSETFVKDGQIKLRRNQI